MTLNEVCFLFFIVIMLNYKNKTCIIPTAHIGFKDPFFDGEMLWFVMKHLFTLRVIVSVDSKSRIDCIY